MFTFPQGLLQLLYPTPDDDQLHHHSGLFKMVRSTGRLLPYCVAWSVLPHVLVVQHAVISLFHRLGLTIKGIQASVLVLCSKAQARYGLDMYIRQTWKSISGQSKNSISPLVQGLSAVLSRRLEVQ